VVRNEIGRILFLKRRYREAIVELQEVLKIDPEDLQAHYNLMLCYRGAGDLEMARKHEHLYRRFKADEASQAITGPRRFPLSTLIRFSCGRMYYNGTLIRSPNKRRFALEV